MPLIRVASKAAQQLFPTPACGCEPLTCSVRNISVFPRQVTSSNGSFHAISFSEIDHPKVLITGMKPLSQCMLSSPHFFMCHAFKPMSTSCNSTYAFFWMIGYLGNRMNIPNQRSVVSMATVGRCHWWPLTWAFFRCAWHTCFRWTGPAGGRPRYISLQGWKG